MAGKRSSQFYNLVDSDDAKAAFAKRLSEAIADRGWSQSVLAREASAFLPKLKKGRQAIGRDLISNYCTGYTLPRPDKLVAIAKALGCKPVDLLAPNSVPSAARRASLPKFSVSQGATPKTMNLQINMEVPAELAMKIVNMLQKETM